MEHTWEEIDEKKKVKGVKYQVGDWVSINGLKNTYGYIESYIIYRNRVHTEIESVTYTIRKVMDHGKLQTRRTTLSKEEEQISLMKEDLSVVNLKYLVDIALDARDKDYFMKISEKLIKKENFVNEDD